MDVGEKNSIASTIRADVIDCITLALDLSRNPPHALLALDCASIIVEALPLATAEYALLCNRIGNAQRYLQCGERGAAEYELKMIARSFEAACRDVNSVRGINPIASEGHSVDWTSARGAVEI